MTIGGFLTDQAGVGVGASIGPRTGLGETIDASFDFTWKAHTTAAAIQYQGLPLNERNDTIKTRFGQDIYDITKMREKYVNPTAEGRVKMADEANAQIDDWILRGRNEHPEKYNGIKTTKEIRDDARKTVDISENHMNEIMLRNPSNLSKMTGGFIGGAGAAILDPPNLLTLPLGAGEIKAGLKGFAAARGVIKAAAIDGSINAAIEASTQPAIMAWQKELGRRYGFGDAAENVALAFVGGAGLSGLIRGGVRGLKASKDYAGSVSADILDYIAGNTRLPKSVRDASSFMSRQAHIDESAPPGLIKTETDLKIHRDTAQKVADDFEAYKTQTMVQNRNEPAPEVPQIKSLERSEYLVEPDVPTAKALKQYSKVEDVPLDAVRSHQSKMRWDENKKGNYSEALIEGYGDKPVVGRLENGEYIVFDGNHRTVNAINSGQKSMPMHVIDVKKYDPERAGRKPSKADNIDDDELLLELGVLPRPDTLDDMAPPERIQPKMVVDNATGDVPPDRVAIAENDLKSMVDEIGDEKFVDADGRELSIKEFAEEIKGKKALIEAMKTCRIA